MLLQLYSISASKGVSVSFFRYNKELGSVVVLKTWVFTHLYISNAAPDGDSVYSMARARLLIC
jgi:hypothetical protein